MEWNAFACIPLANHHFTEIHTYICMHAGMTTSSHPLNVLMSIFGGGDGGGGGGCGGGGIYHGVGTAASLMLRVDS